MKSQLKTKFIELLDVVETLIEKHDIGAQKTTYTEQLESELKALKQSPAHLRVKHLEKQLICLEEERDMLKRELARMRTAGMGVPPTPIKGVTN